MAIDRDAFIDNYLDELEDYAGVVDASILKLKKDPGNENELNTLLRALHTIKGSSRMLKFNNIEKISHSLENVFKGVKEGRYGISPSLVKLVFVATDHMRDGSGKIRAEKSDDIPIEKFIGLCDRASSNEEFEVGEVRFAKTIAPAESSSRENKTGSDKQQRAKAPAGRPARPATDKAVIHDDRSIRIKMGRIDRINRMLNSLIVKQFQFKRGGDYLAELNDKLKEMAVLKEGLKKNDRATIGIYEQREKECHRLMQRLTRNFTDDFPQLERNTFEVQEEVYGLSMFPLELVTASLGKMVEETAMSLGKEVSFTTRGTNIRIDRAILENIQDPLIHLIRNSIDHGIENPDERKARGKRPSGRIQLICSSEGGRIVITVRDDGRGLDYDAIRKRAVEIDPGLEQKAHSLSRADLNRCLFTPGFSTKEGVTDLSGRGVGLDIVKHSIETVKGKITLRSQKNVGTEFIISLPLTLATVEGFFIASAGEKFLVPSTFVKEIALFNEEEKIDMRNRNAIKLRNKTVPVYYLSDILNRDVPLQQGSFVIIVELMGETVGIIIDSIISYASLIYKPLPASLSRLRAIQGIVFDEGFNIINILYMPEIIQYCKRTSTVSSRKRFSADRSEYQNVLVVDDSYSTREIIQSILELEGYRVSTAIDGIEGLARLGEQHVSLIITDIQMPRMDGFTFLENIRRDERYRGIPVVVVTSIRDDDTKKKFMKAGANAFVVKSEFDRENLLEAVKFLLSER